MNARPVIYVLAGVNGAGKSTVGGYLLERVGLGWFNPDQFAAALVANHQYEQSAANAIAWQEGMRRLADAVASRHNFAFETTLGGTTVAAKLCSASATHDLLVWFCGLSSPELHLARVRARVAAGGHDIAEALIRQRYPAAIANLIALMPYIAHLQVFDNSAQAQPGQAIANPILVAEMDAGKLIWPTDIASLKRTPDWAKPLAEAALVLSKLR